MNWIFDHLQLVIALVLGLVAWIKKMHADSVRRSFKRELETNPRREMSRPPALDTEAADRTRQIQEEIRRKIAERTRQVAADAATKREQRALQRSTEDAFSPGELIKDAAPMPARPASAPRNFPGSTSTTTSSRLRTARVDAAKAEQARQRTTSPLLTPVPPLPSMEDLLPSTAWRGDLYDPEKLRRAIVLNEILQPPAGLR